MNQIETEVSVKSRKRRRRGAALITSFASLTILSFAAVSYIDRSTQAVRISHRISAESQASQLCESGTQEVLLGLWKPFKVSQKFTDMDALLTGATTASPKITASGFISGVGTYSSGVIRFSKPNNDEYVRQITVRTVGWLDRDGDSVMDDNEPSKTIDTTSRFELARSQVFDYTYFINNYGWMDGFNQNDLIINGDMRANGNFDFRNGSPTVNGSVIAASNEKLAPFAAGLINTAPVKMGQTDYQAWRVPAPVQIRNEPNADYQRRVTAFQALNNERRRPGYSSMSHGSPGSTDYQTSRDFVFNTIGGINSDRPVGAIVADSSGLKSWNRTSSGTAASTTLLDTSPTKEVIMPDLSNLATYQALSRAYRGDRQLFMDGTPDPNNGQEAYVEVWNSTLGAYQRLSTQGVVSGSVVLVGTADKPIRLHGPVTINEDVVIKGTVEGQGTLYAGRNIHVVGSVRYKSGPDFSTGSLFGQDAVNEKRDFLGLAARGSVMMGNPSTYRHPYPLRYMTPANPPTKRDGTVGRYDENGNWIPPFDAMQTDYTGRRRFQSVVPQATIDAIAEGVNQIDAIMYSNFVGGGNIGTAGGGVTINGTIIARDEALVTWSLPIIMNYDNRIRERNTTQKPLIDLNLPRSPQMLRSTWQDRGFVFNMFRGNNSIQAP